MKLIPDDQKVSAEVKKHLPVINESETVSIHLSGTAINNAGQMTSHKYFDFLGIDLDDYSDISFTPEEAKKIRGHLSKMSTGSTAMVPMICAPTCPFRDNCIFYKMDKAPFGRQCHPSGTKIKTVKHGEINIENLDPLIHSLISYDRRRTTIMQGNGSRGEKLGIGYKFKKASKHYRGDLITITSSSGKTHKVTSDHICIVRFNENAIGKFCVYLMRQGNKWRIGKSKILGSYSSDNKFGHKTFVAFTNRGRHEKADAMWILGIYNTNAEATLDEDYFSCTLQTSKALFEIPTGTGKTKYNGVYAWQTQEQLDTHHVRFYKPESFYEDHLRSFGLDINFPIWKKGNGLDKSYLDPTDNKILAKGPMYMRACNLISDIMDVPTFPDALYREQRGKKSWLLVKWEQAKFSKELFYGLVYSLEVEKYETYFANNIATHNCLVEINLMREWTTAYFNDYHVDPNNFTEITMINELAEIEVYQWRLNQTLARAENAELVNDSFVNMTSQGVAIYDKKISPYITAKETLLARKARLIKLMVGDRQEKYKKEAALKQKDDGDPSSTMADLRTKLEKLQRDMVTASALQAEKTGKLIDVAPPSISPDDIIGE